MSENMASQGSIETSTMTRTEGFRGSEEEEIIKRVLQIIITTGTMPAFLNLVIQTSNALEGSSFVDASVYLRISYELRKAHQTNFRSGYPKCIVVYIKDILNMSVLESFRADGVDAIKEYPTRQAFLTLMEFLREQNNHEKAIKKLMLAATLTANGNEETQILAGLAHHLFSQLVPGKKYEVDEYTKQLPKECGCGCKAKIREGNTSIGSLGTWHGRVDIILNDTIAVTVVKKPTGDTEEDGTDDNEHERKQIKAENDKICEVCVEEKPIKGPDCDLLDQKVLKQILAEAITNGFAQVNRNKSTLSHFLIPTIGATSDHVSICLYDPESDCLLHIKKQLKLWLPDGRLNIINITIIWLFLNFTIFTRRQLAAELNIDKSGLHMDLQEHLECYKQAETKTNYDSLTPVGSLSGELFDYL
ncbi:uncharacterized protein LOC117333188 [Pecten maximus]|uniref:uncharacterized protein LOC117333188 n=1 Tax=Pecten maximus TaxID=6579 RepID=UPI0014582CC3|nr:uncharacterized protein LOC117333188 [Pecten maximus]